MPIEKALHPQVLIEMENGNGIKVELYPEIAPLTVQNFLELVQSGFYDGLIFHRVIPGFMIQGGDPKGNGTGGSNKPIKGEFAANGFENNLKHERGVISMARTAIPDSASSQFFIMVADIPQLDGQYASFGKTLEGMEEVDRIVGVETSYDDKPVEDQRIKRISVVNS